MCQLSALSECSELWKLSQSSQVRDVFARVCVYRRAHAWASKHRCQSGVCLCVTFPSATLSCPNMRACVCVCTCVCVRVAPPPSLQICNRICGSGQFLSTENLQGFTSTQNYISDSRWGLAHRLSLSPPELSLTPSPSPLASLSHYVAPSG